MQNRKHKSLFTSCKDLVMSRSKYYLSLLVMLSHQSTGFGVGDQGNALTQNGVETSMSVTDVSTPLRIHQYNLTQWSVYTLGRST
jgi:hypothetical protein